MGYCGTTLIGEREKMINLIVAAAFLIMAHELVSLEDIKLLVMPMATILAWHLYYLCEFAGAILEVPVLMDTTQQGILVAATVGSMGILWIRERRLQ